MTLSWTHSIFDLNLKPYLYTKSRCEHWPQRHHWESKTHKREILDRKKDWGGTRATRVESLHDSTVKRRQWFSPELHLVDLYNPLFEEPYTYNWTIQIFLTLSIFIERLTRKGETIKQFPFFHDFRQSKSSISNNIDSLLVYSGIFLYIWTIVNLLRQGVTEYNSKDST